MTRACRVGRSRAVLAIIGAMTEDRAARLAAELRDVLDRYLTDGDPGAAEPAPEVAPTVDTTAAAVADAVADVSEAQVQAITDAVTTGAMIQAAADQAALPAAEEAADMADEARQAARAAVEAADRADEALEDAVSVTALDSEPELVPTESPVDAEPRDEPPAFVHPYYRPLRLGRH